MRKFVRDQELDELEFPDEYKDQMHPLIVKCRGSETDNANIDYTQILSLLKLSDSDIDVSNDLWYLLGCHKLGQPHVISSLDHNDLGYLAEVYHLFFPNIPDLNIPRAFDKYASLECAGEMFGSRFARLNAAHLSLLSGLPPDLMEMCLRKHRVLMININGDTVLPKSVLCVDRNILGFA